MPVIEEYTGDESLTLNWTIQNYHLNPFPMGKSLLSPFFDTKKLGDSHWHMELFPRGSTEEEYVACYVWSEIDDATGEYDSYTITLSIRIGDSDSHVQKKFCNFQRSDCWKCHKFVTIEELQSTKLPDNELKILCEICPERNSMRSDLADMAYLSRDLVGILESEKLYDFVLITDDDRRFKVHQSIMKARWPRLRQYTQTISDFEGNVRDISSQTLETMIRYAYSGILNVTDVPRDVFKAAVAKECNSLRKNLVCFPKTYHAVTELNIEHKIVVWHLGDISSWEKTPMSFMRVLPVIELYVFEIILAFSIKQDEEGDDALDVAFRFSFFKPNFPISLQCKMYLSVKDGDVITEYRESQHTFRLDETWHFPQPIKTFNIPDKRRTSMTLELFMSDGPKYSRIDRTETEFFSNFTPQRDLRKLSSDLLTLTSDNLYPSDFALVSNTGSRIAVHRAILYARWPEMRETLVDAVGQVWENMSIRTDIEESVLADIISYVYSGISKYITFEKAQKMLDTKGTVPLPEPLLLKCKWILENENSAE